MTIPASSSTFAAPEVGLYSVSQLHDEIGRALERAALGRVWVTGVITGLRSTARFCSFELVEYADDAADKVRATLPVGAFRRTAADMATVLASVGLELADGLEVAVWGRLDPNPAFGRLRLVAEGIDPRASVGAAVLARDKVVAELDAAGVLAAQARLDLPADIRRLGLVSSPSAAGRADVWAVLQRAPVSVEVVEAAAAMGGPHAPVEVAQALDFLAGAGVDLIVVARGGGARSDLAAWDAPELAQAIASCPVPVWVALGHAGDRTVADLAAQRSHPAPSAAAAAVVALVEAAEQRRAAAEATARHQAELAAARRRQRQALAVALAMALVLVAVLWSLAR